MALSAHLTVQRLPIMAWALPALWLSVLGWPRWQQRDGMKHLVEGRRGRPCAFVLGLCCAEAWPFAPLCA